MTTNDEYACHRCGGHTPDGHGKYDSNGDRLCSACYHNSPSKPIK